MGRTREEAGRRLLQIPDEHGTSIGISSSSNNKQGGQAWAATDTLPPSPTILLPPSPGLEQHAGPSDGLGS